MHNNKIKYFNFVNNIQRDFVNMGEYMVIKVLIAKPGLDGHDRGAKIIARALRDAGMEVIYTGLRQTPEMIVATAIQEDVQVIGLSILSGAHMTLFPIILSLLEKEGMNDVLVIAGGIIPENDQKMMEKQKKNDYNLGISKIFGPGTSTNEIIIYIKNHAPRAI